MRDRPRTPANTGPKPTYCYTFSADGQMRFVLHVAFAPFGADWMTRCDDADVARSLPEHLEPDAFTEDPMDTDYVGLRLPEGVDASSPHLVLCRKCFPEGVLYAAT